jgi:hypothetical protein
MAFPNIFKLETTEQLIARINKLKSSTEGQWGKMTVAQMLAHCCVTYEMTFENIHPKPNFIARWLLKTFVKKAVVNEVPYPKNSRTAPVFIIKEDRDFDKEKARLISYLNKTVEMGETAFDQRESHSFGQLTITEWNNMFYKHLDHHLTQFGV